MEVVSKKILDVPYYIQPTDYTCQSTVCKMVVEYLLPKGSKERSLISVIEETEIYNLINYDSNRPNKTTTNSWANMIWWMQKHVIYKFQDIYPTDNWSAINALKKSINNFYPVIIGVTHSRNIGGHVILVVGYKETQIVIGNLTTVITTTFYCHDPYGHYFKTGRQDDNQYGLKRSVMNLVGGGQSGAGAFVLYSLDGVKRVNENIFQFMIIPPEAQVSK